MIETRRYKMLEGLLPALVTGDVSGLDDEDVRRLVHVGMDLGSVDGGGWSVTGEVVDIDEFATPSVGPRGRVATVVISRDVQLPAHVWVGYWDGDEYVCTHLDGSVCRNEVDLEHYVRERKQSERDAFRAGMEYELADAFTEFMEVSNFGHLCELQEEHEALHQRYRDALKGAAWEVNTDGGVVLCEWCDARKAREVTTTRPARVPEGRTASDLHLCRECAETYDRESEEALMAERLAAGRTT